jgi:hypothetical protein
MLDCGQLEPGSRPLKSPTAVGEDCAVGEDAVLDPGVGE